MSDETTPTGYILKMQPDDWDEYVASLQRAVGPYNSIDELFAGCNYEAYRLALKLYLAETDAVQALTSLRESASDAIAEITFPVFDYDERRTWPSLWSSDDNDKVLIAMDRLRVLRQKAFPSR